jgi:hypothetical protein
MRGMAPPQTILSAMHFTDAVEWLDDSTVASVEGVVASFDALVAVEMSLSMIAPVAPQSVDTSDSPDVDVVLCLPEVRSLRIAG